MFSPSILLNSNFLFYRRQLESELLFNAKKRKKNKKSKKNCNCSENQIEVGINLAKNNTQSCIISDGLAFRKNIEIDIVSLRQQLERVVKEKEESDKYNI